jgi:hypothetical protein
MLFPFDRGCDGSRRSRPWLGERLYFRIPEGVRGNGHRSHARRRERVKRADGGACAAGTRL